jgi:hypothetical protein
MDDAFAGTEGAIHLLVEADVGLDGADAVIGEEHDVGVLLQQGGRAGVQLDHVAVVGVVLGAVEALDVGVGDLHDGHAALVAQGIQAVEVLPPELHGGEVALAIAGCLQILPAVLLAGLRPDQRFQPVGAVDHRRLEVVLLVVEGDQALDDVFEGACDREVAGLDRAETVFGLDEDRIAGAGGEGGLADAGDAVNQDAGRLRRAGAGELGKRNGHVDVLLGGG